MAKSRTHVTLNDFICKIFKHFTLLRAITELNLDFLSKVFAYLDPHNLRRTTHFCNLPQQHSPHCQIYFIPPHLLLFSTSKSHLASLVKLRPISILNPQANPNTLYNHRVTLYIRNEPFHSASLSDYDAYPATKASHALRANEFIQYLNDRGYNLSFLKREIQRVHTITRNETLKPGQITTNQPSRVPLVITYNPVLRSISSIKIERHGFKILSSSPRCNNVFQTTPLVAFRRTDNVSDILVRSKLRTDKQTNVTKGSFRCGKNCITCRYITDGRTNYTFSATGEMRTIHDHIDCNSKNLICMIHCLRCNKQ